MYYDPSRAFEMHNSLLKSGPAPSRVTPGLLDDTNNI